MSRADGLRPWAELGAGQLELLKARGRVLAQRLEQRQRQHYGTIVVVRRGTTAIGLPIHRLKEIRSVRICRLPGMPPACQGIFQVRGMTYSLIELPGLEAGETLETGERTLAALLFGDRGVLGLRLDEIVGPRELFVDELDGGSDREASQLAAAVTTDLVSVLDVDALFAHPEIGAGHG